MTDLSCKSVYYCAYASLQLIRALATHVAMVERVEEAARVVIANAGLASMEPTASYDRLEETHNLYVCTSAHLSVSQIPTTLIVHVQKKKETVLGDISPLMPAKSCCI